MCQITSPSSFDEALKGRLSLFYPEGRARCGRSSSYEKWGGIWITEHHADGAVGGCAPRWDQNDGRYQHSQMLTAHCIVPRAHPNAQLLAMDMAYEVERLLFHRRLWMDEKTLLIDPGSGRHP